MVLRGSAASAAIGIKTADGASDGNGWVCGPAATLSEGNKRNNKNPTGKYGFMMRESMHTPQIVCVHPG